jgi:hypothetical protein
MELITPVVKKQRVSRVKKNQPEIPIQGSPPISPSSIQPEEPKVLKRRGRKPKGGKIVPTQLQVTSVTADKPNILIHLKCSLQDLKSNEKNTIGTYQFTPNNISNEFLKFRV